MSARHREVRHALKSSAQAGWHADAPCTEARSAKSPKAFQSLSVENERATDLPLSFGDAHRGTNQRLVALMLRFLVLIFCCGYDFV